jgi:hypothetical protein
LGALPDSAMIVMSGLGGSVEQAKEQVAVELLTKHTQTVEVLTKRTQTVELLTKHTQEIPD